MNLNLLMYHFPLMINILIMLFMFLPSNKFKIHPLMLNLMLIILTILICLKMNNIYKSLLIYMLFLTTIGGLMIIYMYITSISNNELFKMNKTILMKILIKISLVMLILFLLIKYLKIETILSYHWSNDLIYQFNKNFNFNEMNIMNFYKNSCFFITSMFLIFYLFYSMICIINICYKYKLPLRQINY